VRTGTGQQHGDQNNLSGRFHGFNITAGKVNTNGKSKLHFFRNSGRQFDHADLWAEGCDLKKGNELEPTHAELLRR
jgi:hypothetical protein